MNRIVYITFQHLLLLYVVLTHASRVEPAYYTKFLFDIRQVYEDPYNLAVSIYIKFEINFRNCD